MRHAILTVCLALAAWTWAAAGESPAVFQVTGHTVAADPGAYTATTGGLNQLVDFAWEPMVWRTARVTVGQAAVGRIIADNLDFYDSYASGYWDGAQARVLRLENGQIRQKLLGTVAQFVHATWSEADSRLIAPDRTAGEYAFEPWSRPEQEWWLRLVAVDAAGRASPASAVVRVVNPDIPGDQRGNPTGTFSVTAPRLDSSAPGSAPAAGPAGFTATMNASTGVVTLAWQAVAGIAGYRLERTSVDPAQPRTSHLDLGPANGGDSFAFMAHDLVFLSRTRLTHDRGEYSPRVWGTPMAGEPEGSPQLTRAGEWQSVAQPWSLVPHPGPLPAEFPDGGATCLRIPAGEAGTVSIRRYNHADTTQDWYRVLDPAKTYVVEILARQEGLADPTLRFHLTGPMGEEFAPIDFTMTGTWQRFRAEFIAPRLLTTSGGVGQMGVQFQGPGTVWLDAFRVYEKTEGLVRHNPVDRAELLAARVAGLRTHDTAKTQGYTLDGLLGHPLLGLSSGAGDVASRGNLSALLAEFHDMGVFPWLQLEFTLDEQEWLGLVEYLAAPYDPAIDTPQSKPWAWRRVQHGQPQPYIDLFPRLLLEFSNETWNPIMPFNLSGLELVDTVTGARSTSGETYGLLQEYTIQVMKQSPYWSAAMEATCEFVLGGWNGQNYGYEAAAKSPSSRHMLVAAYNGGWDAGEDPSGDFEGALLKTLNYPAQDAIPVAIRLGQEAAAHAAAGNPAFSIGSYEAGPGYNLDGLNGVSMTPELVETESRVMKSLVGGSSTLDCFLGFTYQGAGLQNFFTFSRNRNYWTSHAEHRNGGQAYPAWMGLGLWNRFPGDVLGVVTERVPTRAAAAVGRRAAMEHMPEVAVYASRQGSRLAVFAISRRRDAPLPLTLRLPISGAGSVTLHTLTGDPAANNLDAENISLASHSLSPSVATSEFPLDASRGAAQGLPPASVFCYVFEGATFIEPLLTLVNPEPGQTDPAGALPLRFRVAFTKPPAGFSASDVVLGGTAQPQGASVVMVPGSHGLEWVVTVSEVLDEGTVTVAIPSRPAVGGGTLAAGGGQAGLRFPAGTQLPLIRWDFAAQQTETDRDWKGLPIPATSRLPVIGAAALTASDPDLLGDNVHYNNDGAGTWSGGVPLGQQSVHYSVDLVPANGQTLDINQVRCGFWASADLTPRVEVWQGGVKVGQAAFVPSPLNNDGLLSPTGGLEAVADTSVIPALRGLRDAVQVRIVFAGGIETTGGIFGIGKLGPGIDDLVVLGRITAVNQAPTIGTISASPPLVILP